VGGAVPQLGGRGHLVRGAWRGAWMALSVQSAQECVSESQLWDSGQGLVGKQACSRYSLERDLITGTGEFSQV
jgi:hypothetical protein